MQRNSRYFQTLNNSQLNESRQNLNISTYFNIQQNQYQVKRLYQNVWRQIKAEQLPTILTKKDIIIKRENNSNSLRKRQLPKITIFIKGYLRLKVLSLVQLNLQTFNAQTNAVLLFKIDLQPLYQLVDSIQSEDNQKDIKIQMVKTIIKKLQEQMVLTFDRDSAASLNKNNTQLRIRKTNNSINFTLNKNFNLRVQGDIGWSPFQMINLILSVSVKPLIFDYQDSYQINVLCNLMDNQENQFIKLSYSNQIKYGSYQMAISKLDVRYKRKRQILIQEFQTIQSVKQVGYQKYIQNYHYAFFKISYFKRPLIHLSITLIPLFILSIINLSVFFQQVELAPRLGTLATLMIAVVALLPIVRSLVPSHNKITFTQILLYGQIIQNLICLIHSLDIRSMKDYIFVWNQDRQFIAVLIILSIKVFILSIKLIEYFIKQQQYRQKKQKPQNLIFNINEWFNKSCQQYFKSIIIPKKKQSIQKIIKKIQQQQKQQEEINERNKRYKRQGKHRKKQQYENDIKREQKKIKRYLKMLDFNKLNIKNENKQQITKDFRAKFLDNTIQICEICLLEGEIVQKKKDN